MKYVGLTRRLVAASVDALILFFGFGFAVAAMIGKASASSEGVAFNLDGTQALIFFALWFVYFVAFEATLGATPGKLLLGVRVRTADGSPIGWLAALVRNLLRLVDVCFGGGILGALLIWLTPRRQRLGDLAAGTVVVRPS